MIILVVRRFFLKKYISNNGYGWISFLLSRYLFLKNFVLKHFAEAGYIWNVGAWIIWWSFFWIYWLPSSIGIFYFYKISCDIVFWAYILIGGFYNSPNLAKIPEVLVDFFFILKGVPNIVYVILFCDD